MPKAAMIPPPNMPHTVTTIMAIMITPITSMRRTIIPTITVTPTIMATIITMTSIAGMSITTATAMLMTTNRPAPKARAAVVKDQTELPVQVTVSGVGGSGEMTSAETAALYRLMTWLSPAFPVGAFSYSSGIEWAVEAGDIVDAASLREWLAAMLADGAGFCDGVFLAYAYRAALTMPTATG
jgi:urease accessory protein